MYRLLTTTGLLLTAAGALLGLAGQAEAVPLANVTMLSELEKRMEYHDNEVYFGDYSSDGLNNFAFEVGMFKITPGQDPSQKNHVGDVHKSDYALTMTFKAGRAGSDETAAWWESYVPAAHSSYNKQPGKLNFAFGGTLTLNWHSGRSLTLNQFFLGQGHTGTSNDWWIGGDSCDNRGSHCQVYCQGTTESGQQAIVRLARGSGCSGSTNMDLAGGPNKVQVWNYELL